MTVRIITTVMTYYNYYHSFAEITSTLGYTTTQIIVS